MEPRASQQKSLNILMGSGVPKRREGGVAAVIYNLGSELEHLGHHVTYIFQEDLIEPGSVNQRFREFIFASRLARFVAANRRQFSIVNLHAPAGFLYGFRRKWNRSGEYPPYVMTLHGLEERRVHAMSREAKKGRAWNFSLKNRLWHRFYHQPRFRWSILTADAAHVMCRDVWNVLQLHYNLDADRVIYIPNGVGSRFFVPREYVPRDSLKLLYAGTWLDQRGIFYIRDAMHHLAQRIPGLTLTCAGGGVPGDEILRFFGDSLASKIIIHPVISADRMPELYAAHDIFLFPSLMENLPLVILEAMASGMPVVTTETCGMPDVVEHEFSGLLIPTANAQAIEDAVVRLANSAELRRKLGENARATMKRYTWERAARQLEALYRHVLATEAERG
jgi:glycosyltransferase involved in cell wall biosynthesis